MKFSLILFFSIVTLDIFPCEPLSLLDRRVDKLNKNLSAAFKFRSKDSKYKGCSFHEDLVYEEAFKQVISRVKTVRESVESYLSNVSSTNKLQKKVYHVRDIMKCIENLDFKQLTFECNSKECENTEIQMFIKTPGLFSNRNDKTYKTIHVCSHNMKVHRGLTPDAIQHTVYHELSHFCGTRDHLFIKGLTENPRFWKTVERDQTSRWHETAGFYSYWFLYGFCVPGKDCEASFSKKETCYKIEREHFFLDDYGNRLEGSKPYISISEECF